MTTTAWPAGKWPGYRMHRLCGPGADSASPARGAAPLRPRALAHCGRNAPGPTLPRWPTLTSAVRPSQYVSDGPVISSAVPCDRIPDGPISAAFRPWCRPPGLDAPRSDTPKVDFPGVESPALLPFPAVQCNKAYPSRHAYLLRTRLRAARDKPYSLDVIRRLAPHASCLSHSSS